MTKQKVNPVSNRKMWCYYAPDGWPQVRTLAESRVECRLMLNKYDYPATWQKAESQGAFIHKVVVTIIEPLKLSQ